MQSVATSVYVGSLPADFLFCSARLPCQGTVTVLEGSGDIAGRPGLVLGCGELTGKCSLLPQEFGGYLRSKKDESFMGTLEVWNMPVSRDTACDSHNLIGDA